MRRIAASRFDQSQPAPDRVRPSLPPARHATSRLSLRSGRPPRQRFGPTFGLPSRRPQSRPQIRGEAAKQVERAWELADDLPAELPVMPGELKVIETYLAAALDEILGANEVDAHDPKARQPNAIAVWNSE